MASEDRQVKPWREVTRHEITAIKKEKCQFCMFAGILHGSASYEGAEKIFCDYIGIAGTRRGCRPDQCDKFKRKTSNRRRRAKEK